jgi:hypothetical protein
MKYQAIKIFNFCLMIKENNGAIAGLVLGIVIPVVILMIVAAALVFYYCYYKKKRDETQLEFDPKSNVYVNNRLNSTSNNQLS